MPTCHRQVLSCGGSPWLLEPLPPPRCGVLHSGEDSPKHKRGPPCGFHPLFFPVRPCPECLNWRISAQQPVRGLGGPRLSRWAQVRAPGPLSCVLVLRTGLHLALGRSRPPVTAKQSWGDGHTVSWQSKFFLPLFLNTESKGEMRRNLKWAPPQWDGTKASPALRWRPEGLTVYVPWSWGRPREHCGLPVLYLLSQRLSLCVPFGSFTSLCCTYSENYFTRKIPCPIVSFGRIPDVFLCPSDCEAPSPGRGSVWSPLHPSAEAGCPESLCRVRAPRETACGSISSRAAPSKPPLPARCVSRAAAEPV